MEERIKSLEEELAFLKAQHENALAVIALLSGEVQALRECVGLLHAKLSAVGLAVQGEMGAAYTDACAEFMTGPGLLEVADITNLQAQKTLRLLEQYFGERRLPLGS